MVKNYAHRGFSGLYPENTMPAFEKALEAGAEGMEFDVHLTKDGVPVIMHDENTLRTTGCDALIKDLTLEEFQALDAANYRPGEWGTVHPSTLREYFEMIDGKKVETNIELKTGVFEYPNIERKVLALIDEFGRRDSVIISSFNHYSVMRFKELAPDVKVGFLEESWLIKPGAYTRARGAEYYHPFFNVLDHESLTDLRNNGVGINAWTINDEADMRAAIAMQLDSAITNWPDRFAEIRREVTGK